MRNPSLQVVLARAAAFESAIRVGYSHADASLYAALEAARVRRAQPMVGHAHVEADLAEGSR